MEEIRLEELNFGEIDGKTEAENCIDLFFDLNHKSEKLVNNQNKYLIIGEKGTGKTYLASYICKRKKVNQHFNILDANRYFISELTQKRDIANWDTEYQTYYILCKSFLLKELAKYIVLDVHPKKAKFAIKTAPYKLRKYLDSQESLEDFKPTNIQEREINGTDVTGGLSKISVSASISEGWEKITTSEKKPFYEKLDRLEQLIKKSIKKDEIILFLDDLDELDGNLVNKEKRSLIILNLIKCVCDLNESFIKANEKMRFVLIVRKDIIEKLHNIDSNLNKIVSTNGIDLYWLIRDKVKPEEHPLMQMIIHKARVSCRKLANSSNKEIYMKLFPQKIDNKDALQYLLDLSFGRPRDFITYLKLVIEHHPSNTSFDPLAIKTIRPVYSENLYNEVRNQMFFHKGEVFSTQCFALLTGLGKRRFSYEDIKVYFEQNKEKFSEIDNLDNFLNFIYEMGIVGNIWGGYGRGKKKYFNWYYRAEAPKEVDLNKDFIIHTGLKKRLNM